MNLIAIVEIYNVYKLLINLYMYIVVRFKIQNMIKLVIRRILIANVNIISLYHVMNRYHIILLTNMNVCKKNMLIFIQYKIINIIIKFYAQ